MDLLPCYPLKTCCPELSYTGTPPSNKQWLNPMTTPAPLNLGGRGIMWQASPVRARLRFRIRTLPKSRGPFLLGTSRPEYQLLASASLNSVRASR